MTNYETEQEAFWAGSFGNEYIGRNKGASLLSGKLNLFNKVLARTSAISSLLELGANIGLNLRALNQLLPKADLSAVEINAKAVQELNSWGVAKVYQESILTFSPTKKWDLVFTCGVLIHINPDMLPTVYDLMYKVSGRYIAVIEYFNPTPVAIPYRNHENKLFKRDFAGEILDKFPDLRLVDYGFIYHRDPNFPQDDPNWFLLEKRGN